ncbi:hypothetical protein [Dyadobacter psychrotolerans]|uniref:Prevent-host-death protein n=1 Tax=Dyadobacter psychrotolerans TaxID=2541721 RepID=A0A4R5DHH9_9BACT|nr:hypothetical protein [Dyadobacter psychrotolerans]TDE11381.1 hypothetical protein E0F88_26080 [Dyadobacter psychrotolerans]
METIPKSTLIHSITSMPDHINVEDVIEQIILLSKIERSRKQIDNGEFVQNEEVKQSFGKWLE